MSVEWRISFVISKSTLLINRWYDSSTHDYQWNLRSMSRDPRRIPCQARASIWLTRGDLWHNPPLRATDILLPWTPNKNQSEEQQIITRCVHIWSPSHQSVNVPSLSRDDTMLSISTGGAGSITVTLSKCHHDVFSRECLFLLYSKLCKYLWKVTRDHQWCLEKNVFKNIH